MTVIIRLVFLRNALKASDRAFELVASTIITECQVCISIVTACIPVAKPFLDAFASGMLGTSFQQRIPRNAQTDSYQMQHIRSHRHTQHLRLTEASSGDTRSPMSDFNSAKVTKPQVTGILGKRPARRRSNSSAQSDRMITRRTDQWLIQVQDKSKLSNETLDGPSQGIQSTV